MSTPSEMKNLGDNDRFERSGVVNGDVPCVSSIYDALDFSAADRKDARVAVEERNGSQSSSSISSIGKNSDESSGGGGDGEEVQSEYKVGAFASLDALKEVLPVKRGISKFYWGKSVSFASLSDAASCSSIKDIAKPEDAYTRKRKNMMAYNNYWDKKHDNFSSSRRGGLSKRPNNSMSMLALAAPSNCPESCSGETSNSNSPSSGCCLPPLPPHSRIAIFNELSSTPPTDNFCSWRSMSLADLRGGAAAEDSENISIPGI
ncbi:protein OXIDATIVE STRESS 3 LIKE 1-like [Primulina tabacum]|uniref:protein OXIDATIVE STRESS 3 LIKE 1-like n=1 Tax=Primulina tabacum TaxID=48773 RepID=UPI003F5A1B91